MCGTPWHVKQPAARGWEPGLGDDEVLEYVKGQHLEDSGFRPMDEYRRERAKLFGEE